MKKLGSIVAILLAVCALVAVWVATPFIMHTNSRLLNFLEVVGAGLMVALGVLLLGAGMVMRGDKTAPRFHEKIPKPPKVAVDPAIVDELASIAASIESARKHNSPSMDSVTESGRIDHLADAMDALLTMLKRRAGLK